MTADVDVFEPEDAADGDVLAGEIMVEGFNQPLTTDEAQALTEHIRSTADVLYVLLARAHAGKAWQALGYASFAAYVSAEFDMSRSRAYQILDQHRVIEALEAAVPDGTILKITEAQARDLKSVIEEVVPAVKEATTGRDPEEAQTITDEVIEVYRDQVKASKDEESGDDGSFGGGFQGGSGMPGTFGGGGSGRYDEDDDFGDDPDDGPQVDASEIRRRVQAAYDFYTATNALAAMPDVQVVLDTINPDRIPQVRSHLPAAVAWLNEFAAAWNEMHPVAEVDD